MHTFLSWDYAPKDVLPRARVAAQRALELDPNHAEAIVALGSVSLFYDWNWEAAEHSARRALELSPNNPSRMPCTRTIWHFSARSRTLFGKRNNQCDREPALRQVKVVEAQRADSYVDAFWIAVVYAALNEADDAFRWLTKAYEDRSASMVQLKTNPGSDPLRDKARFQQLMRRMRFPS